MNIAHVKRLENDDCPAPHLLNDHLKGTAERAEEFATLFKSGLWANTAGYFHDAGKATDEWQKYLYTKSGYDEEAHMEGKPGKIDHSAPGAKLVEECIGKGSGRLLSYCIAQGSQIHSSLRALPYSWLCIGSTGKPNRIFCRRPGLIMGCPCKYVRT